MAKYAHLSNDELIERMTKFDSRWDQLTAAEQQEYDEMFDEAFDRGGSELVGTILEKICWG